MCIIHIIQYQCGHEDEYDRSKCPKYNEARGACDGPYVDMEAKVERRERKCRICRSKDEKERRDKARAGDPYFEGNQGPKKKHHEKYKYKKPY